LLDPVPAGDSNVVFNKLLRLDHKK